MDNGDATDRCWFAGPVCTRRMHEEFHAVTGRAAADTDFVVHRKCVRHRYAHWYYFFNSFENVLVHAPRYDGQTGVEGAQWMQHALAYARAYANAQGPV